eukprot:2159313-Prymnesium_polylepis.1
MVRHEHIGHRGEQDATSLAARRQSLLREHRLHGDQVAHITAAAALHAPAATRLPQVRWQRTPPLSRRR